MALPPLALVSDLSDWIGEPISEQVDVTRAEAVLSAASTLARTFAKTSWPDVSLVDDQVKQVVVQVAARGYLNPEGWRDERADDWAGQGRVVPEAGLFLTASEKGVLAQFAPTAPRGIGAIGTTRLPTTVDITAWVPTEGGPDFPWY